MIEDESVELDTYTKRLEGEINDYIHMLHESTID